MHLLGTRSLNYNNIVFQKYLIVSRGGGGGGGVLVIFLKGGIWTILNDVQQIRLIEVNLRIKMVQTGTPN